MNALKNLGITYKLTLVVLSLAIPIVALVYLFAQTTNVRIEASQKEVAGLSYLRPLRGVFEFVPQHRDLANIMLSGDGSVADQLSTTAARVDAAVSAVDEMDGQLGEVLDATDQWQSVKQTWRGIKGSLQNLSAQESFQVHSRLVADIMALIRHVSDQSNLTVDPELDSYYLGQALIVSLPATIESVSVLRGTRAGIAARPQQIVAAEVAQLSLLSGQVQQDVSAIRRGLNVAYGANPALEQRVSRLMTGALGGAESHVETVTEQLAGSAAIDQSSVSYFDEGTSAIAGLFTLYDESLAALDDLLQARIDRLTRQEYLQVGAAALALLLATALVVFVIRTITTQIQGITGLFARMGIGDFAARAEVSSGDELGTMARSLNSTLDNLLELLQTREERDRVQRDIQKLLTELSGVADGDLTKQAEESGEVTGPIANAFNTMISQIRDVIAAVQATTLSVSSAANEIQTTTEHLAEGSEQQSTQITATSSAVEEMAVSIRQVSANSESAAKVAGEALENATAGAQSVSKTIGGMNAIREQVQETSKRIKRLGESSQEIGESVQLIGDIADRTSILALNASIQAALAGEAGRGFAVVAEEVEQLAERSTEATKRISDLIKSIQTDTNEAVGAMESMTHQVVEGSSVANEAGQRLEQIESVSKELSELIQSISMAANQQARGSQTVADSMSDISQVTQQTAAGAKQASVSINSLAVLADELRNSMDRFTVPSRAA
jgi:twitching motility protein PilJ